MGIGHVAAGLGLKRAAPRVNAGFLVFAALLADFLLGFFALAGWESCSAPAGYAEKHYLLFTFPWSHGLIPDLLWAVLLGILAAAVLKSRRAAIIVAAAVFSHYPLDGIVHVKGLPVAGPGSWEFGLGLWQNLPVELSLEVAMLAGGLVLYLRESKTHSPRRRAAMVVFAVVLAIFTVGGQATATEVPSRSALISSWIMAPLLIGAIAFWIDRHPGLAALT